MGKDSTAVQPLLTYLTWTNKPGRELKLKPSLHKEQLLKPKSLLLSSLSPATR